jgi:hypothetical protein
MPCFSSAGTLECEEEKKEEGKECCVINRLGMLIYTSKLRFLACLCLALPSLATPQNDHRDAVNVGRAKAFWVKSETKTTVKTR